MKRHLYSTVCYPVLNLLINLNKLDEVRKTKKYQDHMGKLQKDRYKRIVNGRPYQPTFS